MALETVVFPQDPFSYSSSKDIYNLLGGGSWSYDFLENQTENPPLNGDLINSSELPPSMLPHLSELHSNFDNPSADAIDFNGSTDHHLSEPIQELDGLNTGGQTRPRRRRTKSRKNKEEIENQRMTHIAVERNRRKQMNEYLSVLKSLMPDSYVQRGDQASIIGGAINFVKELEQQVHFLNAQTDTKGSNVSDGSHNSMPFSESFTLPQYSSTISSTVCENSMADPVAGGHENRSSIADIEVTMVESHANVKIRSKRRPKQLVKMVAGLQSLRLNILHLNVTTVDQFVLYSLSVKVEDECKLSTMDEIATALYELLTRIEEESLMN